MLEEKEDAFLRVGFPGVFLERKELLHVAKNFQPPLLSAPNQGSEETIRVVSMDRDYHVECYHCEVRHTQMTSPGPFWAERHPHHQFWSF